MNSFTISINGEDVTSYACYPFGGELTLDRSLDQAYIELKASPRSKPYPPFSEVVVTPNEGEATTFVIASDEIDTIIKTGLSNHRILLCEETKKLERVICPGKTFVQPLVKNYTQISEKPQNLSYFSASVPRNESLFTVSELIAKYNLGSNVLNGTYLDNSEDWTVSGVTYPITINTLWDKDITLPSLNAIFPTSNANRRLYGYAILLINHITNEIVASSVGTTDVLAPNQTPTIKTPTSIGSFDLYYLANFGAVNVLPLEYGLLATAYQITVVELNAAPKPPLYITDVTNQLLEIAEPIRKGESPRFTLDSETAGRYATTPCNELNFANGATLRENLDEIAGIVHCITRLKNGKILFDKLGEPDYANSAALGAPVSISSAANIEKYATHLDSYVDNLMNAQDPKQGAISDPFVGIFRTPRALISNTDARVTVSNCRINTVFGIEKIEKLEVLYNGNTYDITPFVYEKKEYDLLETNGGVYPYAKAYAIYYTQGQKGLDGLTHRIESPTTNAFKNPAIGNILEIVTGQSLPWWQDAFAEAILDYAFNVTYISAVRGRVRAAKTDISEVVATSAMAFNQSAPRLSSVNYGERLKGETAMLSEPEVHLVFKNENLSAVMDSVGKLYIWNNERYYISKVNYKVWAGYIIAEMTLSRNFNQLGRFVSVNNAFRQFEIDDNSQEECIVYEDYAVFTAQAPTSNFDLSLDYGNQIISSIGKLFTANEPTAKSDISAAFVRTTDSENNLLAQCLLPVQSLALGNALLFNFSFMDNYSAGEFLQSQGGYKLTRQLPYGDPLYGEAKYLAFELWNQTGYASDNLPIEVGDRIPIYVGIDRVICVATTYTAPLIINKSSRDAPNISYMIHHVTDSGFIFGNSLLRRNGLVGALGNKEAYMVALPFELNPLSPTSPRDATYLNNLAAYYFPEEETEVYGYRINEPNIENRVLNINKPNNVTPSQAWAIYSRSLNDKPEFLIGGNGQPPEKIYVYLKHSIT